MKETIAYYLPMIILVIILTVVMKNCSSRPEIQSNNTELHGPLKEDGSY